MSCCALGVAHCLVDLSRAFVWLSNRMLDDQECRVYTCSKCRSNCCSPHVTKQYYISANAKLSKKLSTINKQLQEYMIRTEDTLWEMQSTE